MHYINKYTLVAGLAIIAVMLYLYLYYSRHCNIEAGNTLYLIAGTVLLLVLYSILFIEVTSLDATELGRLKDEKPTVVVGLTFFNIVKRFGVFSAFYNVVKLPIKSC